MSTQTVADHRRETQMGTATRTTWIPVQELRWENPLMGLVVVHHRSIPMETVSMMAQTFVQSHHWVRRLT